MKKMSHREFGQDQNYWLQGWKEKAHTNKHLFMKCLVPITTTSALSLEKMSGNPCLCEHHQFLILIYMSILYITDNKIILFTTQK